MYKTLPWSTQFGKRIDEVGGWGLHSRFTKLVIAIMSRAALYDRRRHEYFFFLATRRIHGFRIL
jgi:hypothetical protein